MKTVFLVMAFVVGMSASAAWQGTENIQPDRQVVYKTIGKVELKLHVFEPKGLKKTDKRPAVVFFFGGGWNSGTPGQFYKQCRHLADQGMVAMSAEYRINSIHKTPPSTCVKDGKSAIRYVRIHAKELGIDPEKVLAGGGSAGGHVAAATGTVKKFEEEGEDLKVSSCPNALILFNPVYDNGPGGYGHSRVKDYWEDFSPMHNISKTTPPTIVFLGTKDKLIPVATAEKYKKLMEKEGVRSDLHLYDGEGHGFFNWRGKESDVYNDIEKKMDAFLKSLGYIK